MAKKIKLGRGLDALLASSKNEEIQNGDELKTIAVDKLQRGKFQPRSDIKPESLTELAESIRHQGVIQPIIVREVGDKYEVIAGERRWRASMIAEVEEVPVVIRPMNDEVALAIGLIENIQREALTPLEEAKAFVKLIEDFNITHSKISSMVGRSRSSVSNLIRLLQLNEGVKNLLNNGDIEMGHGRAILSLETNKQFAVARQVIDKNLTVRQTENLIKNLTNPPEKKPETPTHIKELAGSLSEKTGKKVHIKFIGNKGKISIDFASEEQLQEIIKNL
jgi:ParB family chromosome partitioning protein